MATSTSAQSWYLLSIEVLSVFASVVGLLPRVSIGSRLNLGYESGAVGGHLPIRVGVVVVQEELHIFGGDVLPRLVIYEFEGDVIRVNVQKESWWDW